MDSVELLYKVLEPIRIIQKSKCKKRIAIKLIELGFSKDSIIMILGIKTDSSLRSYYSSASYCYQCAIKFIRRDDSERSYYLCPKCKNVCFVPEKRSD